MKNYYPVNFDPINYWEQDGALPKASEWLNIEVGSWQLWLQNKQKKIPSHLAESLWFNFTASISNFSFYSHGITSLEVILDENDAINKYKGSLRNELIKHFNAVNELLTKSEDLCTVSPFKIESRMNESFDCILLMNAYVIMQIDGGLSALLKGDAAKSASCFLYANIALSIAHDQVSWVNKKDEEKEVRSKLARHSANKRHEETYAIKKQVREYWCKNINLNLSNEKAATLLLKVVPLSHRKLSEYVSEAKKENIHPASKV